MKVELLYGRTGLCVELPADLRLTMVRKRAMPMLQNPGAEVLRSLREPAGCRPLAELARRARSACVAICDVTRPVPNGILLPPLLDTLVAAGLPAARIRILVATGLHRPNEGDELAEVVGSADLVHRFTVENHFARDDAAHVDLGTTSAGIPIRIDRRFVEADLRIVVGLVEPHFMAGYSGGRKVLAPGLAHQDTILAFHSPRVIEHPGAANCVLSGNPLHEAQLEILRAVGEVLALNVVIDESRRIGFVGFGEAQASHLDAVTFMRSYAEVPVGRRFRTILTTSAGYPLDKTYYQTVKGMVGALGILEPGGTIVIASECSEGLGSREFRDSQLLLRRLGPEGFMSALTARGLPRIDEWETEMLLKAMRAGTVKLYAGGLDAVSREATCVEVVDSVADAVAESARASGDPEVAVIPEGPYVIPEVGTG